MGRGFDGGLDVRAVQSLLAGVGGGLSSGSQGIGGLGGLNIDMQALQNLLRGMAFGGLGGVAAGAGGFGGGSGHANLGYDEHAHAQSQALDELWSEEEHNRFLQAFLLQEQSGSINWRATAQHVGSKTEQQVQHTNRRRLCPLF